MLEQFKKLSAGLKYCIFAPIILAVLYLISVADLEYGYYTFLRIFSLVALGIFIFIYCSELESYLNFPSIAATVVLILFNPIAPIELSKTPWIVLDILSATTMLAIAIYVFYLNYYKPAKELEEKEYREKREREELERKARLERNATSIQDTVQETLAYWNQEEKEQECKEQQIQQALCPSLAYFNNLFSRLSHFKEQGTNRYIDIIIYALYKARLCATLNVCESDIEEDKQHTVMDYYDITQTTAFRIWMEKNAPLFLKDEVFITYNRMRAYESTYQRFTDNPFVMHYVSCAFYWMLENGWEVDFEGNYTTEPNGYFDVFSLTDTRELERKYFHIQDEVEATVFEYCALERDSFFDFFAQCE